MSNSEKQLRTVEGNNVKRDLGCLDDLTQHILE